ncbi:MAG: ligase-associated DNA damage response endonuclease PdeM [Pseudomonadota bacterium]
MNPVIVELKGQRLSLLPERAVWWPAQRALLVADVHVGKGTSFRRRGMAVPTGSSAATLDRLRALILRHEAERLIVLGDFLHAELDPPIVQLIDGWRASLPATEVVLVLGNHDRALARQPLSGIDATDCCELAGIDLLHDAPDDERAAVSGHLHPCVRVGLNRSDQLRLPVFWVRGQQLVLPAFGEFTGGQLVQPTSGDRVYAIAEATVMDVTALASRRRSRS